MSLTSYPQIQCQLKVSLKVDENLGTSWQPEWFTVDEGTHAIKYFSGYKLWIKLCYKTTSTNSSSLSTMQLWKVSLAGRVDPRISSVPQSCLSLSVILHDTGMHKVNWQSLLGKFSRFSLNMIYSLCAGWRGWCSSIQTLVLVERSDWWLMRLLLWSLRDVVFRYGRLIMTRHTASLRPWTQNCLWYVNTYRTS